MKYQGKKRLGMMLMATIILSCMGGVAYAAPKKPMDPALAAKREMVRKQQEQRITPEKRKEAAKALKELRMKLHKARQSSPNRIPDNNAN